MVNNNSKIKSILRDLKYYCIVLFVFIILGCFFYKYYHEYTGLLQDANKIKKFILSFGSFSVLVFIIIQAIQVIAFFIPGEIIQVAGGYIYGIWTGAMLSFIGITLGSAIAYLLAGKYGKPLVKRLISNKKLMFYENILNFGKSKAAVLVLYIIPGFPKDILVYICGLTNMKLRDFLLLSSVGRLPGIIISVYFGHKINSASLITLMLLASVVGIVLIALYLSKDTLISKFRQRRKD
ncbi:MAG: TVP38/TMEM64 family protein [Bacillota bacterium]|nr:TVP38/TMEM64 family protein [Bacillota bacterium]